MNSWIGLVCFVWSFVSVSTTTIPLCKCTWIDKRNPAQNRLCKKCIFVSSNVMVKYQVIFGKRTDIKSNFSHPCFCLYLKSHYHSSENDTYLRVSTTDFLTKRTQCLRRNWDSQPKLKSFLTFRITTYLNISPQWNSSVTISIPVGYIKSSHFLYWNQFIYISLMIFVSKNIN